MDSNSTGILVLIVGPSGSGKDTLINGARLKLAGTGQFTFVTREITRPADPTESEVYVSIDPATFHEREKDGHYALSWGAHGFHYGLPKDQIADVDRGRVVVANASRSIIDTARREFRNLRIVSIEVPEEILSDRLHARGRESDDEIKKRLARAASYSVQGPDVINFSNDKAQSEAVREFVGVLEAIAEGRR